MTEKIKAMLVDPESDNDELNCCIDVFTRNECFVSYELEYGDPVVRSHGTDGKVNQRKYCGGTLTKYTTSLDAAMSIGAEELEGWHLTRTVEMLDDTTLIFSTAFSSPDGEIQFVSHIEDLPRAICSARIQALEWKRGK